MRRRLRVALGILVTLVVSVPTVADKRVALVIGNSDYKNVNPLTNFANDADAVTATLKNAGFDVSKQDRQRGSLQQTISALTLFVEAIS